MKRMICAVLALCLGLCGCSGWNLLPQKQAASSTLSSTAETAEPTAAPQALHVYYEQENVAAARALEAYAAAQNVAVDAVDDPAQAGLAVLEATPESGSDYRDLSADTLLAAAGSRAGMSGSFTSLPMGKTLYCYWADKNVLAALLGTDYEITDLQNASWAEWSDFVEKAGEWIAAPAETTVTLSGREYTLPAEKADAAANLDGVFALPAGAGAFSGAAYSGVLVAADGQMTDEALAGPMNGLLNCFGLETSYLAGAQSKTDRGDAAWLQTSVSDAVGLLGDGKALFYRGRLTDALANLSPETCQRLVPVPQKCLFEEEDLTTTDYNLTGLMNYPVLTTAGQLAIPAAADEDAVRSGAGFLLWLYTSDAGSTLLTDTLGLITPWNTASNSTELGALQVNLVSTGVLPGAQFSDAANAGINAAAQTLLTREKWTKADKQTFVAAVEQALGAVQSAG